MIKLIAKEGYKYTDGKIFSEIIVLPDNSDTTKYKEVDYSIWGAFVDEASPKTELDKVNKELEDNRKQMDDLGDALLDAQYEILTFKIAMDII